MTIKCKLRLCTITAALSTILFILISIFANWSPFGDNTIFAWDLSWQYSAYLSYFRKMCLGEVSSTYSLSMALGSGLAGLAGYYLLSPFNLIICLFLESMLPEGIYCIILLKVVAMAVSMALFLSRKKISWYTPFFAVCYAFSSFTMSQMSNIMWLDALIALPFVAWGIEELVTKRRCAKLTLALAYSIVTNFYFGYMLCLFSGYYFLYCSYLVHERGRAFVKSIFDFAKAGLIAVGLSAAALIPVVCSLRLGKLDGSSTVQTAGWLEINTELWNLFSKLYTGAFLQSEFQNNGLPNIFPGILILLLFILLWGMKEISRREKRGCFFLMAAIFGTMFFEGINLVWHGFSAPQGPSFRYCFVIVFLLVLFAYSAFDALLVSGRRGKGFWKISIVAAVVYLLLGLYGARKFEYLSSWKVVVSVAVFLVYLALFQLSEKTAWKRYVCLGIGALCLAELALNGSVVTKNLQYYNRNVFGAYLNQTNEILDDLRAGDGDIDYYRVENDLRGGSFNNDALLLDYNSLTHYSSNMTTRNINFFEKNGMKTWALSSRFEVSTDEPTASFLGVRYLITRENLGDKCGYSLWQTYGDVYVYENEYALPILQLTETQAAEIEYPDIADHQGKNAFWKVLSGQDFGDVFRADGTVDRGVYEQYGNWMLQKNARCRIEMEDDAHISCQVTAEDGEMLLTAFPVEPGWKITVDGKEISCLEVFDTFYGIELTEGEHEIRFEYEVPGLKAGAVASGLAGILFLYVLWKEERALHVV